MIPFGERARLHRLDARSRSPLSAGVAAALDGARLLDAGPGAAVVFIHGYATARGQAEANYRALQRGLEALASGGGSNRARLSEGADLFALHWPGDHPAESVHRYIPGLKPLNWASFAVRIPAADETGRLLAQALGRCTRERVVVVAHSLGCRVALRALHLLHHGDPSEIGVRRPAVHLVLMAAAVPVYECTGKNDFAVPADSAQTRCSVLYSAHDLVLRGAFPLGQGIANRVGEAVGLRGRPDGGRWHRSVRTRHGHGDYWTSAVAAREVHAVLACRPPRPAPEPTRGPLPSLPPPPGLTLPRRRLPRRELTVEPRSVPVMLPG
jgi:hypothetical protein